MARETRSAPDGIYNPIQLHRVFALTSIALFISVVIMIWRDYDREWKKYQRAWLGLERAKVALDLTSAEEAIPAAELQALEDRIAAAELRIKEQEDVLTKENSKLDDLAGPLFQARPSHPRALSVNALAILATRGPGELHRRRERRTRSVEAPAQILLALQLALGAD